MDDYAQLKKEGKSLQNFPGRKGEEYEAKLSSFLAAFMIIYVRALRYRSYAHEAVKLVGPACPETICELLPLLFARVWKDANKRC